jgi:hypothetical protein
MPCSVGDVSKGRADKLSLARSGSGSPVTPQLD